MVFVMEKLLQMINAIVKNISVMFSKTSTTVQIFVFYCLNQCSSLQEIHSIVDFEEVRLKVDPKIATDCCSLCFERS